MGLAEDQQRLDRAKSEWTGVAEEYLKERQQDTFNPITRTKMWAKGVPLWLAENTMSSGEREGLEADSTNWREKALDKAMDKADLVRAGKQNAGSSPWTKMKP